MAMLFSGIKTAPLLAVSSGGVDRVILSDTRWKKVKELITIARAATTKASTSRDLGRRGRLTGRTMSDSCFHLLLRLNLSGITAIKHSLRDIDSRSCKVRFIINVGDSIDRATVNPHSQPNTRMILQRSANLERTPHRLLWTTKKKQRHPVSHRHSIELAVCFRRSKTFGAAHDLIQLLEQLNLLINQQVRITSHAD